MQHLAAGTSSLWLLIMSESAEQFSWTKISYTFMDFPKKIVMKRLIYVRPDLFLEKAAFDVILHAFKIVSLVLQFLCVLFMWVNQILFFVCFILFKQLFTTCTAYTNSPCRKARFHCVCLLPSSVSSQTIVLLSVQKFVPLWMHAYSLRR